MKKLFAVLVLVLMFAFAGMAGAEGTKVLFNLDKEPVASVPESAPEFIQWQSGQIVLANQFPSGNGFIVVVYTNEDETVTVAALYVVIKGKVHLVGVAANYSRSDSMTIWQDELFKNTGTPSGALVEIPQDGAISFDALGSLLSKTEV